mmetsp:Transcript_17747/g.34997  ORF Transcript_17747/g.34997 Transcript_17747/m.34997 type:complete len:289 (-) Transcript_17747:299-1165(-)|eukprot:CAMPEP_0171510216 /NCGR_PEP_ID=MMETSP0959-20130129/236_1 /TAXON_ID=87120 /ORGANISM="Aurantiochytrium limacinum, Strain ATCCMYA-1381" /LENGTH=288 /DNA_ID=CAMNT_0012047547 /DNA_START=429 /DNA_END=1295 /DNA_ORIENTATION=+
MASLRNSVGRALRPLQSLLSSRSSKIVDPSAVLAWPDLPYSSEKECERRRIDVFVPGASVKAFPRESSSVLLVLHGGGFKMGSRKIPSITEFANRCAQKHGLVTMSVGYRLGQDVHVETQIGDVIDALFWAKENAGAFGGDPGRIFIAGHSAGAFLAMHAGISFHEHGGVQGIVGISGVYDLENLSTTVPRLGQAFVDRVINGTDSLERLKLAKSPRLASFDRRMLLLMAQNELPLLKGDAFAIFNSPRRARCILEEIPDSNHWSIMENSHTAACVAAFVENKLSLKV